MPRRANSLVRGFFSFRQFMSRPHPSQRRVQSTQDDTEGERSTQAEKTHTKEMIWRGVEAVREAHVETRIRHEDPTCVCGSLDHYNGSPFRFFSLCGRNVAWHSRSLVGKQQGWACTLYDKYLISTLCIFNQNVLLGEDAQGYLCTP